MLLPVLVLVVLLLVLVGRWGKGSSQGKAAASACAKNSTRSSELGGEYGKGDRALVLVLVLGSGPGLGGERVGVVRARCGAKAGWTPTTGFG